MLQENKKNKINIGIDARIINRRGVGRYIANLIKNLLLLDKTNNYFIYLDKNSLLNSYINSPNCKLIRLNTGNALLYEQIFLPYAIKKDSIDVFHGTDNTLPYIKDKKVKKVVTIHDTMFKRKLKKTIEKPTLKQRLIHLYNKISIPVSSKIANHIITVSNYSKQNIIEDLKISKDKISVIYEGIDEIYKPIKNKKIINRVKEKFNINKPYILTTGASDNRKNTLRVIEAFNIFNSLIDYKYKLVITSIGEKELKTTKILEKIKEFNIEKNVILTGYVTDDEMAILYNGAKFFLFPSIWEGFGLQVLEAFSCGIPVITSDTTSLKEISGDAAYFVNPFSTEDIVNAMIKIEKNKKIRESLVKKGFKRVKNFSWKTTAKETLNIYKKVYNYE